MENKSLLLEGIKCDQCPGAGGDDDLRINFLWPKTASEKFFDLEIIFLSCELSRLTHDVGGHIAMY